VKPETQATPEKIPKIMVIKIAKTKFNTNERITSKTPEIAKDAPNNLLLVNCEKTFGPKEIPVARPKNTDPNKTP
jgi:hypothetical protein